MSIINDMLYDAHAREAEDAQALSHDLGLGFSNNVQVNGKPCLFKNHMKTSTNRTKLLLIGLCVFLAFWAGKNTSNVADKKEGVQTIQNLKLERKKVFKSSVNAEGEEKKKANTNFGISEEKGHDHVGQAHYISQKIEAVPQEAVPQKKPRIVPQTRIAAEETADIEFSLDRKNATVKTVFASSQEQEEVVNSEKKITSLFENSISFHIDKSTAIKFKSLLDNGRSKQAVMLAAAFVKSHRYTPLTRRLLFDFYIDQSKYVDANALLVDVEKDIPYLSVYMNARLAVLADNKTLAISLLEKTKPGQELYENYYGLLAALYQDTKAYNASLALYRELVQRNKKNASFWLGLAVSSDFVGLAPEALSSYQVVRKLNQHENSVMNFVEQRIRVLDEKSIGGLQPW